MKNKLVAVFVEVAPISSSTQQGIRQPVGILTQDVAVRFASFEKALLLEFEEGGFDEPEKVAKGSRGIIEFRSVVKYEHDAEHDTLIVMSKEEEIEAEAVSLLLSWYKDPSAQFFNGIGTTSLVRCVFAACCLGASEFVSAAHEWFSMFLSSLPSDEDVAAESGMFFSLKVNDSFSERISRKRFHAPLLHLIQACEKCNGSFGGLVGTKISCDFCFAVLCTACHMFGPSGERLCKACGHSRSTPFSFRDCCVSFLALGLTVRDIRLLARISADWADVAVDYLTAFRNMQYRTAARKFSRLEKTMLALNKYLFSGHSVWLILYMRSTDWDSESSDIFEVLNRSQLVQSSSIELMCTRTCSCYRRQEKEEEVDQYFLSSLEALEFLGSETARHADIRTFAVGCLKKEPRPELLPYLVNCLKFEQQPNSLLASFLLECGVSNRWIGAQICCFLRASSSERCFEVFYLDLVRALPPDTFQSVRKLIQLSDWCCSLEVIASGLTEFVDRLNTLTPMELPCFPDAVVVLFDPMDIVIHRSFTRPISIGLDLQIGAKKMRERVLIKREDVRRDHLILNAVRLMMSAMESVSPSFAIVTYEVVPLCKDVGVLEMIPNCDILQDLSSDALLECVNRNDVCYKNFLDSLARWSVISFLIGLGDRHRNNILLCRDGRLVHIDFGWVLGQEPFLRRIAGNFVRITDDLLSVIRDKDEFFGTCKTLYLAARRNGSFYFSLLAIVARVTGVPDNEWEELFLTRFLPSYDDVAAGEMFLSHVSVGSSSISLRMADIWHSIKLFGNII